MCLSPKIRMSLQVNKSAAEYPALGRDYTCHMFELLRCQAAVKGILA